MLKGVGTISNHLINEAITSKEIRLIDQDGKQLGIVETQKALEMAKGRGLELVCMSKDGNLSVCKIMDYKKYCFDRKKQEKENAKKNSKNRTVVKEIRLSPLIAMNDLKNKANQTNRFLEKNYKVKVVLQVRGRVIEDSESYKKVLRAFYDLCQERGKIESETMVDERRMTMMIVPR